MRTQDATWRKQQRAPEVQKARQIHAARLIAAGEITIPYQCDWCLSASLGESTEHPNTAVTCLSCGRETSYRTLRQNRKQRIKAVIAEGVDLPGVRP
jgi:hypothetical protein